MVSVGEDRIQPHRAVKIRLCTSEVAEVIFGDASEEECPVIGCVQLGKDIEVLYGLGVLTLRKGMTPTHHEHILVILRVKLMQGGTYKYGQHGKKLQNFMHISQNNFSS